MTRMYHFLKDLRTIAALGLLLALAVIYLIGSTFHLRPLWIYSAMAGMVAAWAAYRIIQRYRARKASGAMEQMFQDQAEAAVKNAPAGRRQEVDQLRGRLLEAVRTIKTSKLGQTTGRAALYEMPWYIVIGNPAAGKSTAVVNSGLNFPFADKGGQAIQGVGGTRNCDWFFTTEGILLDTAGRYAVHEEDRGEWLGFLDLLKKYRPRAPINGIVVVASIAELTGNRPDATIELAKQLRQRIQELTERLELFAPVYVMFTKVDLVAGFVDFFEDSDSEERTRVWGATLPYDQDGKANAAALFERNFDELADGLKELGNARMSLNRGQPLSPGVLTFPMEFIGVKSHLRTFISTMFEENPFQFKPVFRGFYFTSAVQEGVATHATGQRIVQQYGLTGGRKLTASISSNSGFFLRNLFSSVIFSDRNLVRQYASRRKLRLRQFGFHGAALALGLLLGGWSWSLLANEEYVAHVKADLDSAVKIQQTHYDLASRLRALAILQDRIEQLQQYRDERPLKLGFGLYQGDRLENRLRSEYFKGLRQVMLDPVTTSIERFLSQVNANAGRLDAATHAPPHGSAIPLAASSGTTSANAANSPYQDLSPTSADDAYNALKTYLMLADRAHFDPGHVGDQLTRFWRNWLDANRGNASREQIARSAEKLITYYLSQSREPDFPLIEDKLTLVDQTRQTLRVATTGKPARERVYNEITMRASTRFPAITVAGIVGKAGQDAIAGSHAIPGAFTREAWERYVQGAIRDASTHELQSEDWVLKTTMQDDLSLDGSPEQIQKELVGMYKADYASEWKKFMQGVAIADFVNFDQATAEMNLLGDPVSSPLDKLIRTLYRETSWDNPASATSAAGAARRGLTAWFKEVVLRRTPTGLDTSLAADATAPRDGRTQAAMGEVGSRFAAIASLAVKRDAGKGASLMDGYLARLSKIRTRFNQIKNSGDVGPPSKTLMQSTFDGSSSELSDALRYVDESMLAGMPEEQKTAIRPLLVRPLMQAFHVLVQPVENELNRSWNAEVYQPFEQTLAQKYPFSADARVEATPAEIGRVFGPRGSIAKFVDATMGPLVVRRGNALSARTWAEMGIRLNSAFSGELARFLEAGGPDQASAGQPQTTFQLQPLPTPGLSEYKIEIDGQPLRYRNGRQDWANFSWPSRLGQPGASITAVTDDGRNIQIVNFPGQFGLEKLINSAQREKRGDGLFRMTWASNGVNVSVNFRLISDDHGDSGANGSAGAGLLSLRLPETVAGPGA